MPPMLADLTRNCVDLLPEGGLERKLALERPLRVKLGVDATGPDIHIGFAVVLRRLAAFQQEGHTAVLIVGDYTARIGDPSGRSSERPILSSEEIDRNARRFSEQAYAILDRSRTELRLNSEWLGELDFAEILRLARTTTVARLLERDDFAKRFAAHVPISVSELLYPLAQAYDSVAVQADIELGGTDQLYNMLAGRDVMESYGLEPQVVMTTPLLVGTDGVEKMSKSRGNVIGISDSPEEQFGKAMSIPDQALTDYWRLALDREPPRLDPMDSKLSLARGIVARYHGEEAAGAAEQHFTRVVREGRSPEEIPELTLPQDALTVHLPSLLAESFGLPSTSEARRLIDQGGVKLDGRVVHELDLPVSSLDGATLQAGKRRFARLRAS